MAFTGFDPDSVPSPCFVIDKTAVEGNLKILKDVQQRSGAKILAALKAFSFWRLGGLTSQYLSGICASGIHEARLGFEEYVNDDNGNKIHDIHTFSAGFKEDELKAVLEISDHVVFNSHSQWQRFQPLIQAALKKRPHMKFGLRINPLHSEGDVEIYDPCAVGSRLGIPVNQFKFDQLQGISGLHFHTLCEHDFPPLKRTLASVEEQFGSVLGQMEWVNFGGGHLITEEGYQIEELIGLIKDFSARYDVQVYLEPGEAIAIHTGVLVAEVLDIVHNGMPIAILDTSATCHMPDTLEMPYRANIWGSGLPNEKAHTYRLGGMTCLAGDVMGDYSFDQPLEIGQRIVFDDMAHYTMVKTSTFNGINLPSLALFDGQNQKVEVVKQFGYDNFKNRLS